MCDDYTAVIVDEVDACVMHLNYFDRITHFLNGIFNTTRAKVQPKTV